jgi:hypothetical protein
MSQNPAKDVVEVASHDLLAIFGILDELDYSDVEDDGDMATFSGRISQDWFYHVKWKLEAILKSSANLLLTSTSAEYDAD